MTLVLLASVLFATAAQTAPGAAKDIREGKKLFGGMCARCHGVDGKEYVAIAAGCAIFALGL